MRNTKLKNLMSALEVYVTTDKTLTQSAEVYSTSQVVLSKLIARGSYFGLPLSDYDPAYADILDRAREKLTLVRFHQNKLLGQRAKKTKGSRMLSPSEVDDINEALRQGKTLRCIASEFFVSMTTISLISRGLYLSDRKPRVQKTPTSSKIDYADRIQRVYEALIAFSESSAPLKEIAERYQIPYTGLFHVIRYRYYRDRGRSLYANWDDLVQSADEKLRGRKALAVFSALEDYVSDRNCDFLTEIAYKHDVDYDDLSKYVRRGIHSTFLRERFAEHYDTVIEAARSKLASRH